MIKKFNKLMEDMPLFLKIIIGVIMAGIVALMPFFFKIVSAAPTNYPIDAWSMYQNGGDSGALTPGTTAFADWSYSTSQQSYVNVIFPAHNGVVTAHARVETNQPGAYVKFNYYVWIGSQLQNINVSLQPSGNDNQNIDIYFNAVNDSSQAITLQLKPNVLLLPPFSSNVRVSFKVTGSEDVEPSDSLSNDTFINATNNQTNTIVNNITENVNELKEGFINALDENNKTCKDYDYLNSPQKENGYLYTNGTITETNTWSVSDYIKIEKDKNYTLTRSWNTQTSASYCLYDENKSLINCTNYATNNNMTITPTIKGYIRFSISLSNNRETTFTGKYCETNTEATINAIDDLSFLQRQRWTEEDEQEAERNNLIGQIISSVGNLFNFLGDSDVDNPDDSLAELSSNLGTNSVISDLLLLPVSIFQKVLTGINGNCQSFNLGTLYNHNLTMTCINLQSVLGSTLYSVIDILISGLFVLVIRKKFVDIFLHLTSLKTGGNELE